MTKVEILCDDLQITAKKHDGSNVLKFSTGEWQNEQVAQLMKLPTGIIIKLTIEEYGE